MKKTKYYKIQAEAFIDYASKFKGKDLLELFNKWAESKDIWGVDKHRIWVKARESRHHKTYLINEGSREFYRMDEVLNILHKNDLLFIEQKINKQKKK